MGHAGAILIDPATGIRHGGADPRGQLLPRGEKSCQEAEEQAGVFQSSPAKPLSQEGGGQGLQGVVAEVRDGEPGQLPDVQKTVGWKAEAVGGKGGALRPPPSRPATLPR